MFKHFNVRSQLRLVLGEVAVHVEHAGEGMAQVSNARLALIVDHSGGLAPLFDFRPGRV